MCWIGLKRRPGEGDYIKINKGVLTGHISARAGDPMGVFSSCMEWNILITMAHTVQPHTVYAREAPSHESIVSKEPHHHVGRAAFKAITTREEAEAGVGTNPLGIISARLSNKESVASFQPAAPEPMRPQATRNKKRKPKASTTRYIQHKHPNPRPPV